MDRQKIKEQLEAVLKENRQHYMNLCKRKYEGHPPQYKKCREAVAKRFKR